MSFSTSRLAPNLVGALLLFPLVLVAPRAHAQGPADHTLSIFILDTTLAGGEATADRVLNALAERLTQAMASELASRDELAAFTLADAMSEMRRDGIECESREHCPAEVVRLRRPDYILDAQVGRLGEGFVFSATLINPETGVVVTREQEVAADQVAALGLVPEVLGRTFGYRQSRQRHFKLRSGVRADIAVFRIVTASTSASMGDNLSRILAVELSKIDGVVVKSEEDVERMLKAAGYEAQVCGARDAIDECLKVLASYQIQYALFGNVTRVGRDHDRWAIFLTLMDQQARSVKDRIKAKVDTNFVGPERELERAIRSLGRELLGVEAEGRGVLKIYGNVAGPTVFLNGETLGELGSLTSGREFEAGRLDLRIVSDDHYEWHSTVFLQPNEPNEVFADLVDLPPVPWYQKWWVWTIAAGVVAAGGTAVGLALRAEPETGTGLVTIGPGSSVR
jgi:hypothetical protein